MAIAKKNGFCADCRGAIKTGDKIKFVESWAYSFDHVGRRDASRKVFKPAHYEVAECESNNRAAIAAQAARQGH